MRWDLYKAKEAEKKEIEDIRIFIIFIICIRWPDTWPKLFHSVQWLSLVTGAAIYALLVRLSLYTWIGITNLKMALRPVPASRSNI